MEKLFTEHLGSVIVVLIFVIVMAILFFIAKGKYRKIAKQMLLSLVVAAEQKFGDKTGTVKFAYVAEKLYDKMPLIIQILFTETDIANMIEEAVDKMKKFLEETPEASLAITGKEAF